VAAFNRSEKNFYYTCRFVGTTNLVCCIFYAHTPKSDGFTKFSLAKKPANTFSENITSLAFNTSSIEN